MVRYSNESFFSTVSTSPWYAQCTYANVSNTKSFMPLLFSTWYETADEAARPLIGDIKKKFATKEARVSKNQTLYCLAQCTPDLSPNNCRTCLYTAIDLLPLCGYGKVGGRFLLPSCNVSHCLVRYSDQKILSNIETSPMYRDINITDYTTNQNWFTSTLSNQLSQLANDTGDSDERYKTNSLKLNDKQTLYSLGQCTRDLSSEGCATCLNNVITTSIPWSNLGSVGGRIIYPSCNLRFELFPFYMEGDEAQPPGSPPLPRNAVASYLSSYAIDLPTPQEPAFFLHGRTYSDVLAQESSSTQSANSSALFSFNQMSASTFIPR
ncbi:salt stress response/antifungal domain protein [Medicago truncatula]|uniref:Salt stress response/antifungal domain protein n=1 Tax=Medicago truncatula TaxID=3880 RepID=A0A072TH05_MEDTR|nr:salt stress response/antifungal domain protein [Medicago truncatula]